ncbi:nuclear transport factor 2 family protein [Moorena producens JHB]|uniref:Nuclear transport factor 2 family protein n=1 Tax=Moorena producens (strain JHB) TaxID=1454205 RepID=A0A1D9FZE1_MOOP1|nr:nuclear transport factor 2 family protein [Moorena producens]AOY80530.1 nuclear transport factor 2 family protein [Moorena producens JHB]
MTTPAHNLIQSMYEAINRRDVNAAMEWIDDQCIYEDLNFSQPFKGKESVRQLLEESCQGIPDDLKFVIDDITTGDPLAVGILWHVELDGIPFPNGRGVSFYRCSEVTGKLVLARDLVEPPIKPGKAAFFIIRLVSPLIRRLLKNPQDKSTRQISPLSEGIPKNQGFLAIVFGLIAIAYIYILLLSPPGQLIAGQPAWAIQPETIEEIVNESLNFFFILPLFNLVGIHYLEAPVVHPTLEALFNFAEAWIFMFLPLLLVDRRTNHLPKIIIWSLAMFGTNAVLTPYMALRYNTPIPPVKEETNKGILARVFGWTGMIVGIIALVWGVMGRPEFGDLVERMNYFGEQLMTNRLTLAFCVDLLLFSLFQALLLRAVNSRIGWFRFIPFWGLALWLIL